MAASSLRRRGTRAGITALVATALVAGPAAAAYTPVPVGSWTPRDGAVRAVARVGDVVVLGGSFTGLWSPDGRVVQARAGLAAIDASTGALLPWNPGANGEVRALEASADGRSVFVGGAFTAVGGTARQRLAKVDIASGAVDTAFTAGANSTVLALEQAGGRVFVGGYFSYLGGTPARRIGALDATTGARVPGWSGSADAPVFALTADGTRLDVGGQFRTLSGASRPYLGAVSQADGTVTSWAPPIPCDVPANPCYVYGFAIGASLVHVGVGGPGGRVTTYQRDTGAMRWATTTDGDVQAIDLDVDTVYAGGHFDTAFGGQPRAGLVALDADTGRVVSGFAPDIQYGMGVWSLVVDGARLRFGGGFTRLDSTRAQRYAEFPRADNGTPPPVAGVVLPAGSSWRYLDAGTPAAGWTGDAFDDSAWGSGPSQLGFGDGDERTVVRAGSTTFWFRTTVAIPNAATLSRATLNLLVDDGAAVYVNGVEVARTNLPAGTLTPTTRAVANLSGSAESAWTSFAVPTSVLRTGANVIAVEVHQSSPTSSDVSFDAELKAG